MAVLLQRARMLGVRLGGRQGVGAVPSPSSSSRVCFDYLYANRDIVSHFEAKALRNDDENPILRRPSQRSNQLRTELIGKSVEGTIIPFKDVKSRMGSIILSLRDMWDREDPDHFFFDDALAPVYDKIKKTGTNAPSRHIDCERHGRRDR